MKLLNMCHDMVVFGPSKGNGTYIIQYGVLQFMIKDTKISSWIVYNKNIRGIYDHYTDVQGSLEDVINLIREECDNGIYNYSEHDKRRRTNHRRSR